MLIMYDTRYTVTLLFSCSPFCPRFSPQLYLLINMDILRSFGSVLYTEYEIQRWCTSCTALGDNYGLLCLCV